MGWLSKLLTGEEASPTRGEVLPSAVQSWQEGNSSPAAASTANSTSDVGNGLKSADGQKVIPEVEIERVEPHLSGDGRHLELWAHIKNHSAAEVEITRVNCFGQHSMPGRFLKSGETYEIRIYAGDTPQNNAAHKCEVQFKVVMNGDYFQADHEIRYQYEKNEHGSFYIPEEMELIRPIRDI